MYENKAGFLHNGKIDIIEKRIVIITSHLLRTITLLTKALID